MSLEGRPRQPPSSLQSTTFLREVARSVHRKRSRSCLRPMAAFLVAGSALFGLFY